MSDVSSVSNLSTLSRDLYYQYLIDHNSTSTMLNAISGNDNDSLGTLGNTGALDGLSGLMGSTDLMESLSGLTGNIGSSDVLSGLSGLSGQSDSLSGLTQGISGFADILQSYLNAQTTEAANMAGSLSSVLEEASRDEDTSSLTYRTVQEIYQYFQEKSRKPYSLL